MISFFVDPRHVAEAIRQDKLLLVEIGVHGPGSKRVSVQPRPAGYKEPK